MNFNLLRLRYLRFCILIIVRHKRIYMIERSQLADDIVKTIESELQDVDVFLRGSLATGATDNLPDIDFAVQSLNRTDLVFFDWAHSLLPSECITSFFIAEVLGEAGKLEGSCTVTLSLVLHHMESKTLGKYPEFFCRCKTIMKIIKCMHMDDVPLVRHTASDAER